MSKYKPQIKHLMENYVQLRVTMKPAEKEAFRDKCERNGTTMAAEIKKFMAEYQ